MIETVGIPILLKAVDFLFEEGKKILKERRERRKAEQDIEITKPETTGKSLPSEVKVSDAIDTKEVAMSQRISESVWLNSEAKIKHLMSLLEIHTRNYYLAKEQYAKWGSALVPPVIVNNLTESEDAVAETMKALQVELGKVYGKKVILKEV
jgi:hypothetical protein